jgi:hypothetical protein
MKSQRNVVGSIVIGLLVINLVALVWRPRAAGAAPGGDVEVGLASYTIHDRGIQIANTMAGVSWKAETEAMKKDLREAARDGWRIKGYTVHAFDGGTEHYFVFERAK